MDLLSLPDEMIASIIKYKNFSMVTELRKTNSRLNYIAKAYDVGVRFPVTSIQFTEKSMRQGASAGKVWKYAPNSISPVCVCHMRQTQKGSFTIFTADMSEETNLEIIDLLLKKIDLHGALIYASTVLVFNDKFLDVLAKNHKSLRNMTDFGLCHAIVECSKSALRKFVASARKMKLFDVNNERLEIFCQTEMYINRQWEEIWIANNHAGVDSEYPLLNDEFLLKVAVNCKKFYIGFEEKCSSFTIDGVVNLIKTLISEGRPAEEMDLGYIYSHDRSFQTEENKLRSIDSQLRCNFRLIPAYITEPAGRKIKYNRCTITYASQFAKMVINFRLVNQPEL